MKKLIALILAALMLLSLAACGKNEETPAGNENQTENTQQDNTTESGEKGDPAEYSMDYWAEKYPGENICPFYIEIGGVEYSYYRISGLDKGTMLTWINTPLNWNGWHLSGNDIVNGDETYKMTSDWIGEEPEQSFSSGCTITTEPYSPSGTTGSAKASSYHFKGYTETADWPAADMWESFGLPELILTDDVSGAVHISDKEWIYPLNGSDGILIEAWPASSQIDAIVDALKDAGVDMQEDQDFEKGYVGSYDNNGTKMKITVSETGSGKLSVLIVTNPAEV